MRLFKLLFILVFAAGLTGCYSTSNDYARYLDKNPVGRARLPETPLEANYYLTPETQSHKYKFRSATTGIANSWIVEFGSMLDDTLQSKSVKAAFGRLDKATSTDSTESDLLEFNLQNYKFQNFNAHITLEISLYRDGQEIFDEVYHESGQPQGGKMFWGGAMAMKNAVQQSTRYALDDILEQLIEDLNEQVIKADAKATEAAPQAEETAVVIQ